MPRIMLLVLSVFVVAAVPSDDLDLIASLSFPCGSTGRSVSALILMKQLTPTGKIHPAWQA